MNTTTAPPEAQDTRTAAELEAAIADGTELDITAEQLRVARDRDHLAGLRAEGKQRNAERATERRREAAIDELVADIAAHRASPLDALETAAFDALVALLAAVDDSNAAVDTLIRRMKKLGVHGDRGLTDGTERIGFRSGISVAVTGRAGGEQVALVQVDRRQVAARLAERAVQVAVDEQARVRKAAEPKRPCLYFLTEGGATLVLDVPLTRPWAEMVERKELREISRAEYDRLVAARRGAA